jgi:hypothetical protein
MKKNKKVIKQNAVKSLRRSLVNAFGFSYKNFSKEDAKTWYFYRQMACK